MSPASPPTVSTQPKTTSSMAAGSTPVRSISARMLWAPRSAGWTLESPPPRLPTGERTASTMKASLMASMLRPPRDAPTAGDPADRDRRLASRWRQRQEREEGGERGPVGPGGGGHRRNQRSGPRHRLELRPGRGNRRGLRPVGPRLPTGRGRRLHRLRRARCRGGGSDGGGGRGPPPTRRRGRQQRRGLASGGGGDRLP